MQNPTGAREWQPPLEHRAVLEADRYRKEAATKLLGAFRQMVDAEILSAEAEPGLAAQLETRHFCSDDTLLRYLMYCNGDNQKALASLKATVQWRAEFLQGKGIITSSEGEMSKKSCQHCMKDPRSHCFLNVGTDVAGHHVIYSCAGSAMNKKPLDGCKHMALELERLFDGNSSPGRIVWLINMAGVGIADCNPRTPLMALPMFFNHYPERFAQIVVWGMPAIFHGMYTMIWNFIDQDTKSRVLIQRSEAERTRYAEAYWSSNAEMAAWLNAARRLKGAPADYPDISLSRQLGDKDTRITLERCAALKTK